MNKVCGGQMRIMNMLYVINKYEIHTCPHTNDIIYYFFYTHMPISFFFSLFRSTQIRILFVVPLKLLFSLLTKTSRWYFLVYPTACQEGRQSFLDCTAAYSHITVGSPFWIVLQPSVVLQSSSHTSTRRRRR